MEEHLNDIKRLLATVVILLVIVAVCQVVTVLERVRPSSVEARVEEIVKVDLVRVGGYHISKWEFLGGKK